MPKSVTVTFEDGSNHIYDNVPDEIDDQTVRDRASEEFKKTVSGVTGGAKAPAETSEAVAYEPTFGEQLAGGAQTAFDYLKKPAQFAMEHPIATGVGISLLPEAITNKVPVLNQAAQYGRAGLQRLTGIVPQSAASAKVGPGLPAANSAEGLKQVLKGGPTGPAQTSTYQKAFDVAQKMRQIAAQRVIPAAGAAAVPAAVGGAVGAGGLAASNFAANQLQSMTPEQRRKYYEDPMLGAMGGDTGFAAAIMNRGQ